MQALHDDAALLVALGVPWSDAWAMPVDDVPTVAEALERARGYVAHRAGGDA